MGYKTTSIEVGTRFGRLLTIGPVELRPRSDGRNRAWVPVVCECGSEKTVIANNLFAEITTSCGCYHREAASKANKTHGKSGSGCKSRPRLYRIWRGMTQRCTNPNARSYRWYGAKGIKVCEAWKDFEVFQAWSVTHGYAAGLELDRKDSDRDYSPVNCRWVTKKQNLRNRDMFWSDELDERLISFAAEHDRNPYEVIEAAVVSFLDRKEV